MFPGTQSQVFVPIIGSSLCPAQYFGILKPVDSDSFIILFFFKMKPCVHSLSVSTDVIMRMRVTTAAANLDDVPGDTISSNGVVALRCVSHNVWE